MAREQGRRKAKDQTEVSCCIKYLLFSFNVFFWVSGYGHHVFCKDISMSLFHHYNDSFSAHIYSYPIINSALVQMA